MNELEQLKKLVLDGGYDSESRRQVAELEERLHQVLVAENLSSNPVIQEYVKYLQMQSENCTYLLSHERRLTDLERLNLFDKRDLCDRFIRLFTGEGKQAIEQDIKNLLDVASTHQ